MLKKIGIILLFVAAVGARHAVSLQGLPLLSDTAFADSYTQDGKPCPPECVSDSMEIVTWYPSPYNEYEELRLYPVQRDDNYCDNDKIGLMYYDDGGTPSFGDNDKIRVCKGASLGWQEVGGADFWKASTTVSSNIYTDKSVKFGSYSTAGRPTCNADTLGAVIFDTNKNNLYLCKLGGAWEPVGGYSYTQSFTIPGTYNFVVPNGITEIMAEVWSAGGGGGGGQSWCYAGGSGSAGGSSSVGSLISSIGGGGGGGGNNPNSGAGGNGGTSSAPINISGQNGTSGGGGGAGGFGAGNGGGAGGPCNGCTGPGGGGGGGAYGKGTFNVISGALYTVTVAGGGDGGGGGGCCSDSGPGCNNYGGGGTIGGNGKVSIYY